MADNKRKMHVHRVYQTDDQGNIEDDQVWIDLARIDKFTVSQGADPDGSTGQIVHYLMDWGDEASPVRGRTYHELKIEEPDSGGSGGASSAPTSIALQLIETATFVFGASDDGTTGQKVKFAFVNDPDVTTTKRKVTKVRVPNVDVSSDIKFPDVSVGSKAPPSSPDNLIGWDDYSRALNAGTPDDSQYVDTEIVDSFTVNFPSPRHFSDGTSYQLVKFLLKNDDLEQLFKSPSGRGVVYRIDPFQTIVNVSWGGLLAVEFE